ncbi:MAG: DUF192 domain-containing protein [Nanoarchaeota archaeon]|nr:DUF192 domain-containing protein [Nanoarchaeota archaeon]MBU0963343.1 DUF192 domain-containing protein [Nanoarchaeota archaeon]
MKLKINKKRLEFELCDTLLKNFRGLMFSKKKNLILIAAKESRIDASIHSLFVFFPFNAVFLNSKKEMVDHKKIRPFSFYMPKKPAKYVLETCEDIRHIDKKFRF